MRKAQLDKIATIEDLAHEDLAHGAAGDRQPDRAAISWREQAGKTRILKIDGVRFGPTRPLLPIFGDPSQPDEVFK